MKVIDPGFLEINAQRAKRWHPSGIIEWSLADWLVAVGGELGEAMNVAKKIRRIEDNIVTQDHDHGALKLAFAEELADVFCYLTLVAERASVDLNAAVTAKFNLVSDRYGFPEKLP